MANKKQLFDKIQEKRRRARHDMNNRERILNKSLEGQNTSCDTSCDTTCNMNGIPAKDTSPEMIQTNIKT